MMVLASRARRKRAAFFKATILAGLAIMLFTPKMHADSVTAPVGILLVTPVGP